MNASNQHKKLGLDGEALACATLKQRGFRIFAQNYRRFSGEIDIIAYKENTVVFIEVKTRYNPLFDMTELICHAKQQKIIATAKQYCAEKGIVDMVCRFDVALVTITQNSQPTIIIIENAFTESF